MRALQEELFERLAEQGHPDVRPGTAPYWPSSTPAGRATELSARSGQHKQIVGTIVDELTGLGYVRREPDPADRRAKRIVPTEHGLDEIAKARAILAAIEDRHRQTLGNEHYTAFRTPSSESPAPRQPGAHSGRCGSLRTCDPVVSR